MLPRNRSAAALISPTVTRVGAVIDVPSLQRSPFDASGDVPSWCIVTDVSSLTIVPRYAEIDQQGVVFNGHYLTWFDEACTALLGEHGIDYAQLMASGVDFKVVHSEIDYRTSVRWRDGVRVDAVCDHIGTTSFAVAFTVLRTAADDPQRTEQVAVRGRNVYVVVSTDSWAKRDVPDELRRALDAAR
jgi:acyl-CoA thioester hydrolase